MPRSPGVGRAPGHIRGNRRASQDMPCLGILVFTKDFFLEKDCPHETRPAAAAAGRLIACLFRLGQGLRLSDCLLLGRGRTNPGKAALSREPFYFHLPGGK